MDEYLERESKWQVDETFVLPALDDALENVRVMQSTIELTSTYFDTADHDLLAHDMTLRRRDGDDDNGWQLKVPADDGRTEIRTELSDSMPDQLTDLTRGVRLGKELGEVATINTTRDRYRILTSDDELWAEVADDRVRATVPSHPDETMRWREVEIEAGPAAEDVSRVVDRLVAAGAEESSHSSKLERALGVSHADDSGPSADAPLREYLREQIDTIFAGDVGLRRKLDPIHDTRVACRRLRSTLRVFGKLLDPDEVGDTEDELKWFAGLMGPVRDCHVQRKRFAKALAEMDPKLVVGSIATDLDNALEDRQMSARSEVTAAMESERYLALLTKLQKWMTKPPIADPITAKALKKRARKAARKADERLAAGLASGRGEDLHRARKAAKRARYAGELIGANKSSKHYKKIQKVLGEHQDSIVASDTLLGIANEQTGMNMFTLGVLHAREQRLAAKARSAVSGL